LDIYRDGLRLLHRSDDPAISASIGPDRAEMARIAANANAQLL
jgi:hypothetical protein